MAAAADSWTGILLAVLTSSAIGAVVGGYLTTLTRGRIEREEAWRTRLIDAADDFNQYLVTTLRQIGDWLPEVANGHLSLRDTTGTLDNDMRSIIKDARKQLAEVETASARVVLLFGGAETSEIAFRSMRLERFALRLLEWDEEMIHVVEAVISERTNPGSSVKRFGNMNPELSNTRSILTQTEEANPHLRQDEFVKTDDQNLGAWAILLHSAASHYAGLFMISANAAVHPPKSELRTRVRSINPWLRRSKRRATTRSEP